MSQGQLQQLLVLAGKGLLRLSCSCIAWQYCTMTGAVAVLDAGRLSRSGQPALLLEGNQLGPACCILPLLAPRLPAPAEAADQGRPQTPQVGTVHPRTALVCHQLSRARMQLPLWLGSQDA